MPDQFGRYNLSEMRTYVLRNLALYQAGAVDPTTGDETGTPLEGLNPQFSVPNLNIRLNSSATKVSILITAENEKVFGAEVFFDVVGRGANPTGVGQTKYAIPADMCQIRGLWWKAVSIQAAPFNPGVYLPMSYQDQVADNVQSWAGQVGRPTWRIVGNSIVLNEDPSRYMGLFTTNPQGLWFRYIRFNNYLVEDSDYLDFPYARVAQEIVVWDTTLDCVRTQDEVVDASGIQTTLQFWSQQLEILVRNEYRPPEMQLKGPGIVKNTFSGR